MTHTPTQERDWEKEFVEEAADLEHERWARWQHYLHSKCTVNKDGSLTIPAELVDRWKRQITTSYFDLSDSEKESDRKEARTYIPLIDKVLQQDRAYLAVEVEKIEDPHPGPRDEDGAYADGVIGTKKQVLTIINGSN